VPVTTHAIPDSVWWPSQASSPAPPTWLAQTRHPEGWDGNGIYPRGGPAPFETVSPTSGSHHSSIFLISSHLSRSIGITITRAPTQAFRSYRQGARRLANPSPPISPRTSGPLTRQRRREGAPRSPVSHYALPAIPCLPSPPVTGPVAVGLWRGGPPPQVFLRVRGVSFFSFAVLCRPIDLEPKVTRCTGSPCTVPIVQLNCRSVAGVDRD
jgi:hypothetical protein